jgi:hypothetical protein
VSTSGTGSSVTEDFLIRSNRSTEATISSGRVDNATKQATVERIKRAHLKEAISDHEHIAVPNGSIPAQLSLGTHLAQHLPTRSSLRKE